jgi:hypothetical protein
VVGARSANQTVATENVHHDARVDLAEEVPKERDVGIDAHTTVEEQGLRKRSGT